MRAREAHIVLDGIYRLPSDHLVRVEADLGGGALQCRYTAATLSAAEHMFTRMPAAGTPLYLAERFIAKHARGPLR